MSAENTAAQGSNNANPTTQEEILRTLANIAQALATQATTTTPAITQNNVTHALRCLQLPPLPAPEELTFPAFLDWKQRWKDYSNSILLQQHPLTTQHGVLRSALHKDWTMLWSSGRLQIGDATQVEEAVAAIGAYLRQKRNPILDRQAFHKRDQQPGESIDQYYAALRLLDDAAAHTIDITCTSCTTTVQCLTCPGCDKVLPLARQQQEMRIRDRLICGLRDPEIQRRVVTEQFSSDLTLDRVLRICVAMETSSTFGKEMSTADERTLSVNATSSYKRRQQQPRRETTDAKRHRQDTSQPCRWCGSTQSHRYDNCPARNATCDNCGKLGHFRKACLRRKQVNATITEQAAEQQQSTTVQQLSMNTGQPSVYDSVTYRTNTVIVGSAQQLLPVDTIINGVQCRIPWLADSGAGADLLPEKDFKLLPPAARAVLSPQVINCVGANGIGLDPIGTIKATLQLNGHSWETTVGVCRHLNAPLLSKQGCIALQLIPKGWPHSMVMTGNQASAIIPGRAIPHPPTTIINTEGIKAAIMAKHADAFDDTVLRPMHGPPMKIELVDGATPCKRYRAYNVPFHWKDPVKKQLEEMVAKGVIEKVPIGEPVDWCHPMVVVPKKGSSEPRITVDLTGLNKFVRRPAYPVRVPREVVAGIPPGMKYFTTLDARHGYWQVPLDSSSRKLTTFITPWGCYRYCRNAMGLISAGDEHNRRGDEALNGISNVAKVVEDIIIYDRDLATHEQRVEDVISRCREHGITLNAKKFHFAEPETDWCGFHISSAGYAPARHLYSALTNFPVPTNKTDIRSFNGLVQQFEAFSHRLTEMCAPIRSLLSSKAAFVWEEPHQRAFREVINELCSSHVLAQFQPQQPLRLETDAAQSKGLGYALYQQQYDGAWRPLQVGSRFVTAAESRYSATEIEMLAVVWAVRKCKVYLLGYPFELIVDHRPLIPIINNKTLDELDNHRLIRFKEKLSSHLITAIWRAGVKHTVVDVFSRYPATDPDEEDMQSDPDADPEVLIAAAIHDPDDGSRVLSDPILQSLRTTARQDSEYRRLREAIIKGVNVKEELDEDLRPYWKLFQRLSLQDELILLGSRLLIPARFRPAVLKTLHASHQGRERTLRRARQTVFWPGITNDITNVVKSCAECARYLPSQPKEPLVTEPQPEYPFQHVGVDLFSYAGHEYLVMVDRYSGWPTVAKCHSTDSTTIIRQLRQWMTDLGIPEKLVSDNGPQFSSQDFRQWTQRWNITHSTSSPHYPQSNGLAEACVKAIKYLLAKSTINGDTTSEAFLEGLMEFRNTPRADGRSPAQLLFGFPTRTKLPIHRSKFAEEWKSRAISCDQKATTLREKAKQRYDARAEPLPELKMGDVVLIQDHQSKRWSLLGEILELLPRGRSYLLRTESGRTLRRNRRFLRLFQSTQEGPPATQERQESPLPRRSTRQRRPPTRFANTVGLVQSPNLEGGHEGVCINMPRATRQNWSYAQAVQLGRNTQQNNPEVQKQQQDEQHRR